MENKPTELQFQMKISSINVLRFSQYDVEDFDINRENAIEYLSDYRVRVLEESEEIAIEAAIKMKVQELNKDFGELKIIVKFKINPFDTVIQKQANEFKIPDVLILNLFNIVASTSRGILHEKLRGTVLQNEVFPLVDIREQLFQETR